jgi:hypothetical protein
VIATTGTPATVAVQFLGQGTAATAGVTAIGAITVAALATARAFMRAGTTDVGNPESPQ